MSSAPDSERPRVALEVEPRLLRDALVRALGDGVVIVDLRDGAECDIILASDPSTAPAGPALVVPVGEGSSGAGPVRVSDLVELVRSWNLPAAG